MGYSRKYPHHPMDDTELGTYKFQDSQKKDNCSFCRIPEPVESKSRGIPEFHKNLNGFPGILVKICKILRKFVDSSHTH